MRHNRDIFFLIFFNMKVCCVFSLESPHGGNSNEYTQYNIFNIHCKKEDHPKLSQICSFGIFSKGSKNEFETVLVNEPSVFEPLKFYCKWKQDLSHGQDSSPDSALPITLKTLT